MFLRDQLLEYYEAHPESFHYIGEDEEVKVDGFGGFLESKRSEAVSTIRDYVKVRNGQAIDPWGAVVRFGLDRNHDGYIAIAGKSVSTDHINPPRLDYKVALAVILGRPDDDNKVRAQVAKR